METLFSSDAQCTIWNEHAHLHCRAGHPVVVEKPAFVCSFFLHSLYFALGHLHFIADMHSLQFRASPFPALLENVAIAAKFVRQKVIAINIPGIGRKLAGEPISFEPSSEF